MSGSKQVTNIVRQFDICGQASVIQPYGSGHINTTYLVQTTAADCPDYVLQKINHHVFKNVPALMRNIQLVSEHLRNKLRQNPNADPRQEVLTLIPTQEGALFYRDDAGGYWRMYLKIPDSVSFDVVENAQMAFRGGRAFGRFLALLADLPASELNATIAEFHDLDRRLRNFYNAVKNDPAGRLHRVQEDIAVITERAEGMQVIHHLSAQGRIPQRITHNDTKFNNILFDRHMRARCIIDLDTVMPGLIHFDFGDAIRTCANTAAEDEADLSKVCMDIERFRAYARGFLSETAPLLNQTEIDHLAFSVKLMTFIIGLRFLTDYLEGDHYYRIRYKEHNLVRARAQFQLLRSMEEQYDTMRRIIDQEAQAALRKKF